MKKKIILPLITFSVLPLLGCNNKNTSDSKESISTSIELEALYLDVDELELNIGETYQLLAAFKPSNYHGEVIWSSSNNDVAIVENGLITAKEVGLATIFATSDEITACCTLTVFEPHLEMIVSPSNGEEISLASDEVMEYLSDYSYGGSEPFQGLGDIYYPKNVDLSWEYEANNIGYYEVRVGTNNQLDEYDNYITLSNKLVLSDLYVDTTYYWQIYAYDSDANLLGHSLVNNFVTAHTPRTLFIEGVSNSRDIGGKETINGKKVKQGMIYRMANLDSITEKGQSQALYNYNIKTDLDLRNDGEGKYQDKSPISDNTNYIRVSGCYWTGGANGLDVESNWANRMLKELKVFTNTANYPIAFHCAIGQDRTGSLALVLGGLLGFTGKELDIDYELSSFSSAVWDDANPIYVTDKLTYQYGPLYAYLDSFGNDSNSFMEKVELFVKAVGLTDEEIASIRSIMWED